MAKAEKDLLIAILDREWSVLSDLPTYDPALLQYASAVWTLLELLPTITPGA